MLRVIFACIENLEIMLTILIREIFEIRKYWTVSGTHSVREIRKSRIFYKIDKMEFKQSSSTFKHVLPIVANIVWI